MSSDARVDDAIVRAGSVDYLDFWFVTKLVSDVLGGAEQARVHEVALDSIESLTREGRLRVGDLESPGEFVPWGVDVDATVDRVRRTVNDLDHPPNVGDVAWFEVIDD